MRRHNKTLDLTNNNWKQESKWVHVGKKIEKIEQPKIQRTLNKVAVINLFVPGTAGPITSPIIVKIGRKLGMKSKVKVKYRGRRR